MGANVCTGMLSLLSKLLCTHHGRASSASQPSGIITALWRAKMAAMAAISAAEMSQRPEVLLHL
jgi:hypothetical protein